MSSNSKGDDTSVRVALRIRPQSAAEQIEMCRVCTTVTPGHPQVILGKDKAFTFDYVFEFKSKQEQIYNNCVRELVDGCLDGYNATVLAYGQTGSGKTYTMGTGFDVNIDPDEEGIIPRAVEHLFSAIDKRKEEAKLRNEPQPDFKVTVQFMELYNEDLLDLCDPDGRGRRGNNVKIHEDVNGNIYCMGVTLKAVKSGLDTLNCLQQGALSRTTASTNMNTHSSRSHAIFTMHVKQQRVVKTSENITQGTNNYEYEMLTAKFNFVDLAGSERLKRTGATGDRAKEGISINCGLLALGNVISSLGDVSKKGIHVPYRDSKLTRLLQDSLGGNSRTLMIACVSPSDRDFMETLNTLKYANRARNIKNKVSVNQDKASKQISMLRAEIQKLTMELVEFRQGRRVSNCEGESDVAVENNLLKNENEKLKIRIKALSSTVETQSSRITDLMSAQAIAGLEGVQVDGGVEHLIQNYLTEIEELRNKLTQSEVMAASITRNHALKSRMNYNSVPQDTSISVLQMAKSDLAKQKQRAQKLKEKTSGTGNEEEKTEEEKTEENSSDELTSGDEEDDDEEGEEADSDSGKDGEESEVKDSVNDDSSSDEKESESEGKLAEELAELSTEIEIKEKLVEELELSQQRMQTMKTQYEEKLVLLTNKIRETEDERDHVLQNIKEHDSDASKKVKHMKEEYEKNLSNLKTELKKLQAAKKNHAQLLRDKARNEQQLRTYTNELNDMKKVKAKLMKQMKDEVAKNKQKEMARNKEIAQLKKVSRQREIAIKNLQSEKRQKEIILKRKTDEIKALRRQQKPVSGPLGAKKNQVTSTQSTNGSETPDDIEPAPSGFGTYGYRGSSVYSKPYGGPPRVGLAAREKRKRVTIEQSAKMAKKKWDKIERKVGALIIQRQTISNIEKDMDRWIKNRDDLSKQLEECRGKFEAAVNDKKDESTVQEMKDQLEAHNLHMDYIQENIDNCQACIIEMEDPGTTITELNDLISSCMLHEARALLAHFLNNTISVCQIVSSKEASIKELEGLLEITKEHNTIQQTLLSHVLAQGKSLSAENLTNIADPAALSNVSELLRVSTGSLQSLTDDGSVSSGSGSGPCSKKDKARRRTGSRQDFLYPDRMKTKKTPSLVSLKDEEEQNGLQPLVPAVTTDFGSAKQISPELMQKLLELEKARKDANGNSKALNGSLSLLSQSTTSLQSLGGDPKPLVSSHQSLPAPLVRGNLRSKSARAFPNSKYGSVPGTSQPRSQPASPTSSRKNSEVENEDSTNKINADNVFSRLTSNLGQDSDPDVGRMLPLRPPTGKPSALVCTYAATGHNSAVLTLDVTDDYMFTGSKDKTVKVWDLNTGEEVVSLSGHKRDVMVVRYCRLTRALYSVSQNFIKIWDLRQESAKCVKTLSPQSNSSLSGFISGITSDTHINDLRISSGATSLYAAMGNTVRIWDLRAYSMTGKLGGHTAPIMSVLERRRGDETLVFTGSRDHFVKIYELGEGSAGVQYPKHKLEPPHYDGVQCISIRGTALFSGSRDNSIKKWDYTTHQLQQHLIGAHTDWICALDFLPKTNVLLSGCRRGALKLWQADTCQQLCEIKAHRHPINAIATNSSCVFTASSDRLVRLWRVTGTLDEQLEDLRRAGPV